MSQEAQWAAQRHAAEVAYLWRMSKEKGRQWVRDYLDDPKVRGRADALRRDLNAKVKHG